MAPEFLPFIAFVGLAALALFALVLGVVLTVCARYQPKLAALLRALSVLAFSGLLVVCLVLFFLGRHIRQQYFLNEPLVIACRQGQLSEVQRLLDRGASPDAYGIDYMETALIAAARSGSRDIVGLLLRRGADPELRDSDGKTAAERAKEAKHNEIASVIERSRKVKQMRQKANKSTEPTGASRSDHLPLQSRRRLAPAAHAHRSASTS